MRIDLLLMPEDLSLSCHCCENLKTNIVCGRRSIKPICDMWVRTQANEHWS
jgi:hypothetical protein